jgi:hypothetical protein
MANKEFTQITNKANSMQVDVEIVVWYIVL